MSTLDITLFGWPHAKCDGISVSFRRRQTLALLAFLAAADQSHSRDVLTALFWPELGEQVAHAALRRTLHDLGLTFGKGWLDLRDHDVALYAQSSLCVDVRRFHDRVRQVAAHSHASHQLCDACLAALYEAVALYRDDFLAGFTLKGSAEFDAWQTFTTESLRLEPAAALDKLTGALANRYQFDLALPHARRRVALDPLDEAGHRLLMQLYASTGDRAAAARQYAQCVRVLAVELGVEPATETNALYRALVQGKPAPGGEVAGEPPTTTHTTTKTTILAPPVGMQPPPTPHNLPPDVTPFIGRQAALGQVAERLADPACRLLTILGPGGIGKTRLAIQAARGEFGHFPHGVYFVDLAPIPSAELLSAAILGALQVPRQATDPDRQLTDFLKERQMLLVLDNYEHLLTGPDPDRRDGYGLVTKLTATAPQLKLLVTSRARLKVPAEWLAPLDGLETPPSSPPRAKLVPSPFEEEGHSAPLPGGGMSGEERAREQSTLGLRRKSGQDVGATLEGCSSVALFLACARRLRPGFQLGAAEAQNIAHICRLLEGMPLAIEIAAAWTRILPLDEITCQLEHGLDLLTTPLRGVPDRQRSMVATFDHSWRLLTAAERSILRQLSVFRGGFTLEAAEAVAGAGLNDLANLVDASWLGLTASGRYAIHELVRQYCADKLEQECPAQADESRDPVRRRHAVYFADLLASRWHQIFRRKRTITELATDMGNLIAAWDWALAADDLQLAWGLGNDLGCLADRQGHNPEIAHVLGLGIERLRAAQTAERGGRERWRERAIVLAKVLTNQSERFARLGRLDNTEACLTEAADWLAEAEAEDIACAEAQWFYHRMVAWTRYDRGDFAGSMQMWCEVLTTLQMGQVAL